MSQVAWHHSPSAPHIQSGQRLLSPINLKNKIASYFTRKKKRFIQELQGKEAYSKTIGKLGEQRRGMLFYIGEGGTSEGCGNHKSIGANWEFRV